MASKPPCTPHSFRARNLRSKAGSKLESEIIGLGENALLSCEEMVATVGGMIKDNDRLMRLNRGIREHLALDRKRRKRAAQKT
jgi:hypothetical protein